MPETAKTTTARRTGKTAAQEEAEAAANVPPIQWDSLAAALAAFQSDMPTVHKGQTARIPGKDGRAGYSYQYADLADVAKVAHPLLAKHGLAFNTRPRHLDGVGFVLEGVLRHTSGQEDVGCLPITGRSAQDLGSSLTYLRRYLLGCMTGIVTDEDEDGGAATEAGTARPQADTPPAYETQDLPVPAYVGRLNTRISALPEDVRQAVSDWWVGQGLPNINRLEPDQAAMVAAHLTEVEGNAPDPS